MYLFQSASAGEKSRFCSASSARIEYSSASFGAAAINFESSAVVSLGGRRTVRKKTLSNRLPASISSTRSPNTQTTNNRPPKPGATPHMTSALRENFNFHLPCPDVVRKILRRHRQLIFPRRQRRRNHHFA